MTQPHLWPQRAANREIPVGGPLFLPDAGYAIWDAFGMEPVKRVARSSEVTSILPP
jgi:hypothetical protein